MKSLKEIQFKKAYDSDRDDLLKDFYIPAISAGVSYKRLAGFFSSGILSAAARGVADFIENGGSMKLIVGIDIHEDDYNAMQSSLKDPERYILEHFDKNFKEIEDLLREDKVEALGWMLANHKMEIKLGLVRGGGLFHLKVGIIEDKDGNKVSFSGSDNETPSAWKHNVEEFKVFRGWIEDELDYFKSDEEKFDRFWSGKGTRAIVVNLPDAIRDKLVKSIPHNKKDLKIFKKHEKSAQIAELPSQSLKEKVELRECQNKAFEFWEAHQNKGIFAMATGAGKTITALMAAKSIFEKKEECCAIIAVPQLHLATQWIEDDIRKMFPDALIIEAHSQASEWRAKVSQALSDFGDGFSKQIFIVTLYATLSSKDFLEVLDKKIVSNRAYMLIADEMHNLGAPEYSKGMIDKINIRLGLSATPTRYFDEKGTKDLEDYFGDVYEYSIADAIRDKILVPYEYHPIFIEMTGDEFQEYVEISEKIKRNNFRGMSNADTDGKKFLEYLFRERVKIIKKSKNKLPALEKIIIELKKDSLAHKMLIYCDSIEQVKSAQEVLNSQGIYSHKLTEQESMKERKQILDSFAQNNYDALVAVKILDEGVNVPSVETAVIVASSTNPREYIQRRGRVLRKSPGKHHAHIYDFIVLPPSQSLSGELKIIEQNILKREINRVQDFYNTAENKSFVMSQIIDKMIKFGVYLN
ncbi:MAG: DEAD/DEAH box helicase family protein [Candidatus Paceibacterota bacterium]|jgi:superfamily II DNA or RNA helicase